MTGNLQNRKVGNTFKAFTLIEVLIVLTIISLVFTTVIFSFKRVVDSSLNTIGKGENLKKELLLFWELQRAFYGAKRIMIKEGREVYLITSAGEKFRGLVKRAFIYKEGTLYSYEFPYPSGSLDLIEEEKLQKVNEFKNLKFYAIDSQGKHENYDGLPDYVVVEIEDKKFTFKLNGKVKKTLRR